MTLARPSLRIAFYTLLAMAAAIGVMFAGLGADRLYGDEAHYALCVDNMIDTGQWLSPAPYPGAHYFQKPPLQMWLTAMTYHHFPDVLRYRVWPAAFGVATVVLLCIVAGVMFSPEVGLLAALILSMNNRYVFEHGVRAGTFDSGLTFLTLASAALAWYASRRPIALLLDPPADPKPAPRDWRSLFTWLALGVTIGLAGLLKPVAGWPVLALLMAHAITLPRGRRRRQVIGLLIALGGSILVMAPWYLAETARFGGAFWRDIVGQNIIRRTMVGVDPHHLQPIAYYPRVLTNSSPAFLLGLPAMLFGAIAAWRGRLASAWRWVSIVGIGWVAFFSLSHSKATHYLYPAFPMISLMIAGMLAWIIALVADRFRSAEFRERAYVVCYAGLIITLLLSAVFSTATHIERPGRRYEAHEIFRKLRLAIEHGQMRCVIAGFPTAEPIWYRQPNLDATDKLHLRRICTGGAVMTDQPINTLLADRRPILLITPAPLPAEVRPRIDPRFALDLPGYSINAIDIDPALPLADE